jgi:predicted helicase
MGQNRRPRSSQKSFIKNILDTISFKPTLEDMLNYIYAVLHCHQYRKTCIKFLGTDFPSVPMVKRERIFYNYAVIGKRLTELHTM